MGNSFKKLETVGYRESNKASLRAVYVRDIRVLRFSWDGLGSKVLAVSNSKFLFIDTSSSAADKGISGYVCLFMHSTLLLFFGGDSDSFDGCLLTFCVRVYINHFQEPCNSTIILYIYNEKVLIFTSELLSPKNLNFACKAFDTDRQSFKDGLVLWHISTVPIVWTIYFLSLSVRIFLFSLSSVSWRKHGTGNGSGSFYEITKTIKLLLIWLLTTYILLCICCFMRTCFLNSVTVVINELAIDMYCITLVLLLLTGSSPLLLITDITDS